MLHPFREGNGRTIRLFIKDFAKCKGYIWDFENMDKEAYMKAMISATSDTKELIKIFLETLSAEV